MGRQDIRDLEQERADHDKMNPPIEIEKSIRQDEDLCDLLLKMMTQYREDRCSVEEALKHSFFKKDTNIKIQTSSKISKSNLQSPPKLPDAQTENITK